MARHRVAQEPSDAPSNSSADAPILRRISAGSAADEARDLGQQVTEMVKDQPLASLGIALGVGVLIGFMLRR